MSARDNAYKALRELYVSHQGTSAPWDKGCTTCGARMEKVMAVVDAFAHELAERLHALRAIVPDAHKDQAWKDGYAKAVEIAISYIDPMKEGDRG